MTANRNERDAYDLGHYWARKFTNGKRAGITYSRLVELLSSVMDLTLHAYALDSAPPVGTEAFADAFSEGFHDAWREEGK